MSEHRCVVCGADRHQLAYCCKPCKRVLDRIDSRGTPNREARLAAMKESWDGTTFRCHYTGWPLTIEDAKSPFHLTWEHRTPGDEDDIVTAAAMINDMKSDLTESEFRDVVMLLAKRFSDPGATIPQVRPTHWRR